VGTFGIILINSMIQNIYSEDTENGRFYVIGDKRYPSVTTVLGQNNKQHIDEWREKIGEKEADKISKYAANRGSAIHDLAESYLKTGKIEEKNPFLLSLFLPLSKWLDNNIQEVILLETPLYSHKLKMAGRVDCVAKVNNKICVIDFKTSTKKKKKEWIENYYLQCTAYAIFYYEMYGVKIDNFYICITEECSNTVNVFEGDIKDYVKKLIDIRKEFKC
jgi:ATP-dependent exoDNAse (exonuclease V) beta subunit